MAAARICGEGAELVRTDRNQPRDFHPPFPAPADRPLGKEQQVLLPGQGLGQRGTGGDSGTAPLTDLH